MLRLIAVAFICLLVCSVADAREIFTNDGRVIVEPATAKRSKVEARRLRSLKPKLVKPVEKFTDPSGSSLITEARRWLGSTARQMRLHRFTLWCAAALDRWLRNVGLRGTGSDLALSYAHWGRPAPGPAPGVIAVMRRRGGGHVGIVTAVLGHGRIRVISGNHGRRVREAVYSTRRVVAWRRP